MALDLFKFLRGNSKRKEKKNYDPSNPLSSTKFLEGMENTSVQPADPPADPPEVIGRGKTATRRILNAPKPLRLQRRKPQERTFENRLTFGQIKNLKKIGFEPNEDGSIKMDMGANIAKGSREDMAQKLVFRDALRVIRENRKSAAQARYDEQMKARNKRVTAMRTKGGRFRPTNLKPEDLKTLRQAARDQAFTNPLGENTMLGRASANRQQRQLAMKQRNIARKKEDKEDNK